jgi:exopolysaccharide biosynthesis protein
VLPDVTHNGTPVVSSSPDISSNSPALKIWYSSAPGIDVRYEDWKTPAHHEDTVTIVRLNLQRVHISIGYQPDTPLSMNAWMKKTGALAMINGGYFDATNKPEGLLISDGQGAGTSYVGFGGMLAVDTQGNVSLRSLRDQPYDNNEQLQQATQSSPMLVINGQRTQFTANTQFQRRSVVATDKQGHLLLIASPSQEFTLDEMANLLANSDLSIENALNLDGGSSTGLYVTGKQAVSIDPLLEIPIVIEVK